MKTYLHTTILLVSLAAGPLAGQQSMQQRPPQPVASSSAPAAIRQPAPAAENRAALSLLEAIGAADSQRLWDQASQAVFVVPAPDLPAEGLAVIHEDLVVMCRIFDKAVAPVRGTAYAGDPYEAGVGDPYGAGVYGGRSFDLYEGRPMEGRSRTQGLYLDGYGALFFVQVGFPLIAPPQEQEPPRTEPSADPLWTRTVEELQGSRGERSETVAQEYDAQRVESLKSVLIKSLRHAANLRTRGPQDAITVVITTQDRGGFSYAYRSGRSGRSGGTTRAVPSAADSSDMLVLRTTKSDADAFAKGDLTADQFTGKVQILRSWTNAGGQVGSATGVVVPSTGLRRR